MVGGVVQMDEQASAAGMTNLCLVCLIWPVGNKMLLKNIFGKFCGMDFYQYFAARKQQPAMYKYLNI